jgi:putative transposase
VAQRPRWGFWKLHDRLRLDSERINHKRLHRVYCAMKPNLPRRTKRRLPTRLRRPLAAPAGLNQIWALDFMADTLYGGRVYRTLNFIDGGNRQVLGIEISTSIPSLRVIRVMEQLIEMHGKPNALRLDNGPELTSVAFTEWCASRNIEARFIQSGKPDQNAFIERFNKIPGRSPRCLRVRHHRTGARDHVSLVTRIQRGAAPPQPRPGAALYVHAEAKRCPGV